MGLPSSVNFRVAQVDPTSLIAAPSRTADSSGGADAFERHLDRSASPETRAAERRDDQRQRERGRTETRSDAATNTAAGQPASDTSAPEANSAADLQPTDLPLPTTESADAAPKTDTQTKTDLATKPATPATAGTTEATASTVEETTNPTEDDGLHVEPAIEAPAKNATAVQKPDDDGKTVADKSNDAAIVSLLVAPPAPQQQAIVKTATRATAAPDTALPVAAPTSPADAALTAAAEAQSVTGDAQPDQPDAAGEVDADSGLAVKPKVEGLGHQAAADMAEKTSERATTPAQPANAPAIATVTTAASFAKAANAASGSEVQAISATTTGDGTLDTQIGNLQGTGNTQQTGNNGATIRIGTLPGQTTPTVVPAMAIALQIARNVQKGINRFDIRLDPPELGRIDVRMEVQKDGHVAAHMTVEHASTLDLLQRDARALQQALSDAGLQADSDSLSFSLQDQSSGGNAQDSSGSNAGSSPLDTGGAEETVKGPVYNLNLSASGGVDIRV